MFSKRWKYPTKEGGGRGAKLLPVYSVWYKMIQRCNNPKSKDYSYYGGRGITVCEEWLSYDNFYEWAMSSGYTDTLTLDREDNNINYSPDNCRWVNRKIQARNTSKNVYVDGKCLSQIAEENNLSVATVSSRYERGYIELKDLTAPPDELRNTRRVDGKSLSQVANEAGLSVNTVRERWKRGDRSYERLARGLHGA